MNKEIIITHPDFKNGRYGEIPGRLKIVFEEAREEAERLGVKYPNRVTLGGTCMEHIYVCWTSNKMKNILVEKAKEYCCKVYADKRYENGKAILLNEL